LSKGSRRPKSTTGFESAAGRAAIDSSISNTGDDRDANRLTFKQMARTLLFQVVASIVAIQVTLCVVNLKKKKKKRANLKQQASKLESFRKNISESEITIIDKKVSSIDTQQLYSVQKQLFSLSNHLRELKRMQAPSVGRFEIIQSVRVCGTLDLVKTRSRSLLLFSDAL